MKRHCGDGAEHRVTTCAASTLRYLIDYGIGRELREGMRGATTYELRRIPKRSDA